MREKFSSFMQGRNGNDSFNIFLHIVALALLLIESMFSNGVERYIYLAVIVILGYTYFRMLSRNLNRRREENGKFMRIRYKISAALKLRHERWVQRLDYKFFTCPSCKTSLRVPRGHGKINIVCRKCGNSFMGKT